MKKHLEEPQVVSYEQDELLTLAETLVVDYFAR